MTTGELIMTTICRHERTRQVGNDYCWTGCVGHDDCDPRAHGNVVYTVECLACGARRVVASNQGWSEAGGWGPSREQRAADLLDARNSMARLPVPDPVTISRDDERVGVAVDAEGYLVIGPHRAQDEASIIAALPPQFVAAAQAIRRAAIRVAEARADL